MNKFMRHPRRRPGRVPNPRPERISRSKRSRAAPSFAIWSAGACRKNALDEITEGGSMPSRPTGSPARPDRGKWSLASDLFGPGYPYGAKFLRWSERGRVLFPARGWRARICSSTRSCGPGCGWSGTGRRWRADRLSNPPGGVSGELIAPAVFELSAARIRPMLPSWIKSSKCRPRLTYFLATETTRRRLVDQILFGVRLRRPRCGCRRGSW